MNIIVCLKMTFATEESVSLANGEIQEDGVKFVINPYDEYALEEAVRLKERTGAHVTAVTLGPERAEQVLRTALAVGADEAAHIVDEEQKGDEHTWAVWLAAWIRQKQPDLILTGQASVDNGAAQVGTRIAGLLGIPHIASVTGLELSDDAGAVTAHRDAEGDTEIVTAMLPLLVTAQQGLNEPRYPSLPGIMKAKRKTIERVTPDALSLPGFAAEPGTAVVGRMLPTPKPPGVILSGTPKEQAQSLAESLSRQLGLR